MIIFDPNAFGIQNTPLVLIIQPRLVIELTFPSP